MRNKVFIVGVSAFFLSGCGLIAERIPFLKKQQAKPLQGGVYRENFDPERLVDLIIVKKVTGEKFLGLFPRTRPYLEGYLRGIVVDYEDTPIQGVIVRAADKGKDLPGYDSAVSDANGVYRVRFSLPIKDNKIDVIGSLAYNPPWEQQLEILGAAFEPQTKETRFRLYYDRKAGIVSIGEDAPKTVIRKVTEAFLKELGRDRKKDDKKNAAANSYSKPSGNAPKASPASAAPAAGGKKSEDFFGGFSEFGP